MEASILIVSRNREAELKKNLQILENCVDKSNTEILVFLDGCLGGYKEVKKEFSWVDWQGSTACFGASRARNILYKHAKGEILFGFDDDAHPLQRDFINITKSLFAKNSNLGIIAFKEIKGVFASDDDIPEVLKQEKEDYYVNDFLGCGFAIKKEVYKKTRGFPIWIDIYGEEICVALETLEQGYDILFTHKIAVNHRTDKQEKNLAGANYFRFGKQLKNTTYFYLVYYPFPLLLKKILKLYAHNFRKYGSKNWTFLRIFFSVFPEVIFNFFKIMKYRKPVSGRQLKKINQLQHPEY